MRIGFVGTGVIGGGMARRALAAGHQVAVHDLRADIVAEHAAAGAATPGSGKSLASISDFVVLSLPRAGDVEQAMHAPEGVVAGLLPGSIVIDASSVPPEGIDAARLAVKARGASLIDAPLCPSQDRDRAIRPVPAQAVALNAGARAAWSGNLCFFAGGDAADIAAATPVFDLLGVQAHHVGPLGSGRLVKLLHNAINLTALAVIAETMVVARRSGLDVRAVIDALTGSLADSAMLRTQGRDYIAQGHFPRGLFPLHYSVKDLGYALECARAAGVVPGVSLGVTSAAHALFSRASQSAYGDYYNPAIYKYIDEEAGGLSGFGNPPKETPRKA